MVSLHFLAHNETIKTSHAAFKSTRGVRLGMAAFVLVNMPHGSDHYSARRPKTGLFE